MKYWQHLSPEQAEDIYMVSPEIAHDPRNQFYFYLSRPEIEGNWLPDGDAQRVFAAFTAHPTLDYLTIFQFGTIDPVIVEILEKDQESFLDTTGPTQYLYLNKEEIIDLIKVLSFQADRLMEVKTSTQTFKRLEGDEIPKLKGFAGQVIPSATQYYLQIPNAIPIWENSDRLNLLLFIMGGKSLVFKIYQIPTNYFQISLNDTDLMNNHAKSKLILSRSGIVELIRILEAQAKRL
ncbi:MAG TPA: hypothetical protein VHO69_01165 [Phototrophicaceae bacterium]|nr:hypothetical protein [Phototrophicaceae bacterium]